MAGADEGTTTHPSESGANDERRVHRRHGLQINKVIRARACTSSWEGYLYLYLVDLSEGGMRVNLDRPFPPDESTDLAFDLEGIGAVHTKVNLAWQKCLAGGTWVAGLEFNHLDEEQAANVHKLLEAYSPEGRRLRFRLRRLIPVAIRREGADTWCNVTAMDLSPDGMRVRCYEPADQDEQVDVNLGLDDHDSEFKTRAAVKWVQEVGGERYEMGLSFHQIHEAEAALLSRFIDACVGLS